MMFPAQPLHRFENRFSCLENGNASILKEIQSLRTGIGCESGNSQAARAVPDVASWCGSVPVPQRASPSRSMCKQGRLVIGSALNYGGGGSIIFTSACQDRELSGLLAAGPVEESFDTTSQTSKRLDVSERVGNSVMDLSGMASHFSKQKLALHLLLCTQNLKIVTGQKASHTQLYESCLDGRDMEDGELLVAKGRNSRKGSIWVCTCPCSSLHSLHGL